MSNVNKVILIGRLTETPEAKFTATGTAVTNVTVVTNSRYQDKEVTSYHPVVVWGKSAEFLTQYARKGATVYVEGRLNYSSYEKEGRKIYKTDVVAENVQLLNNPE